MHMCYNMTHENQAIFLTSSSSSSLLLPFKSLIGKDFGVTHKSLLERLRSQVYLYILITYLPMRSFLSLGTFGCQLLHRDRLHVYFFQFSLCLNCQIGRPAGGCLGVHRCMHYKWHHFSSCVYTTEFSNGGLLFDFAEQTYLGT